MRKRKMWVAGLIAVLGAGMVGRVFLMGAVPGFLAHMAVREDAFSRQYISWLKNGDLSQAESSLAPNLTPKDRESLPLLKDYLSRLGDLVSIHLVNISYFNAGPGQEKAKEISYYADFQKSSLLIQLTLLPNGNSFWVDMFHYQLLPRTFEDATTFRFSGLPLSRYLFLLLAVFLVVFTFYALVQCLLSRVRRKWLWVPFILAGIGRISLVWDDPALRGGGLQVKWLALQAFSGGLMKTSLFQPWTVCAAVPLGAVWFYFYNRKLNRETAGKKV